MEASGIAAVLEKPLINPYALADSIGTIKTCKANIPTFRLGRLRHDLVVPYTTFIYPEKI
jgi:hypothetical protein